MKGPDLCGASDFLLEPSVVPVYLRAFSLIPETESSFFVSFLRGQRSELDN